MTTASGVIRYDSDEARAIVASRIAGVLAECAVARLTIASPGFCMAREVMARTTDLPRELTTAAPGTTFTGEGVALLVDQECLRWVASDPIAAGLQAAGLGTHG